MRLTITDAEKDTRGSTGGANMADVSCVKSLTNKFVHVFYVSTLIVMVIGVALWKVKLGSMDEELNALKQSIKQLSIAVEFTKDHVIAFRKFRRSVSK